MIRKGKSKLYPVQSSKTNFGLQPSKGLSPSTGYKASEITNEGLRDYDLGAIAEGLFKIPEFRNKVEDAASAVVEKSQIKIIAALGVFGILILFVSTNIQIFSRLTSLNNAIVFVVLMFVCLSGFAFLLHLVLSNKSKSLFIFLVIILLGLAVFIRVWPEIPLSKEESSITAIEQRVSDLEKTVDVLLQVRD